MIETILLGALVLMFGFTVAVGAVAAAVQRDLRALAESHRALQAKVLALAPAQLDALDAAVSARLVALEAPTDAAVIAALQAAKATPVPPDAPTPGPVEAPPACAPAPTAPTDAEVEAELARRGVGSWMFERRDGLEWYKRTSPRSVPYGTAYVHLRSRTKWEAEMYVTDLYFEDEATSGYLRADESVDEAKRRASAALLALLRKHAP